MFINVWHRHWVTPNSRLHRLQKSFFFMVEEVLVAAVVAVVVGSQGGGKRQSQDNVFSQKMDWFSPRQSQALFFNKYNS